MACELTNMFLKTDNRPKRGQGRRRRRLLFVDRRDATSKQIRPRPHFDLGPWWHAPPLFSLQAPPDAGMRRRKEDGPGTTIDRNTFMTTTSPAPRAERWLLGQGLDLSWAERVYWSGGLM